MCHHVYENNSREKKERVDDVVAGATVLENPTEELESSTTEILH